MTTTTIRKKSLPVPGPEPETQAKQPMLLELLGLSTNPFSSSVSERDQADRFAAMYVDPRDPEIADESGDLPLLLLDQLLQPKSHIVLADYGMGKTATSYALEYALRSAYTGQPTLHVRFTPHVADVSDDWPIHCLKRLTAELTIDLLIQFFERFGEWGGAQRALTPTLQAVLTRRLAAAPESLRNAIRAIVRGHASPSLLWKRLRPTVRQEILSDEWRALLKTQIDLLPDPPTPIPTGDHPDTIETVVHHLAAACADARQLGFANIVITVDAVDDHTTDTRRILDVVRPLLDRLPTWQAEQIFLNIFLPVSLHDVISIEYSSLFYGLTPLAELATIPQSSPRHLSEILAIRLRNAAAHDGAMSSLDWLKGADVADSIQDQIVYLAAGSPRRVIELADALLRFHEEHGFQDHQRLTLTATEWQQFVRAQTPL